MKIGLLAYHNVPNFGANLQCFSTYKYLKNLGHEPIFIDWRPEDLLNIYDNKISKDQINSHFNDINTYLTLTKSCTSLPEVAKVIEDENIEAVIIGSDAVLQHHNFLSSIVFPSRKIVSIASITSDRKCPNPFWGSFDKFLNKKIPFALLSGSAQTTKINLIFGEERKMLGEQISKFSYVSVRDTWTKKFVEHITEGRISPNISPDPVFGFNYNFENILTKEEILKKYNLPENYCLVSFKDNITVNKNWTENLKDELNKSDLTAVAFPFPTGIKFDNNFDYKINIPLNPIDWYYLIKYSKGYIGQNMHPIVTSLHNVVPFYCFDHYVDRVNLFNIRHESSKIYHIVENAGISDNRISFVKGITKIPNAKYVVEKIINFDKDKVSKFSQLKINEYKTNMENILKSFQEFYER